MAGRKPSAMPPVQVTEPSPRGGRGSNSMGLGFAGFGQNKLADPLANLGHLAPESSASINLNFNQQQSSGGGSAVDTILSNSECHFTRRERDLITLASSTNTLHFDIQLFSIVLHLLTTFHPASQEIQGE